MGTQYDGLNGQHVVLTGKPCLFLVGAATATGRVNIPLKGMDSPRTHGTARTLPVMRQIQDMSFDLVQKSCGHAVPFFGHPGGRDTLKHRAMDRDEDGIEHHWSDRNATILDGRPTLIGRPT